MNKLWVISFGFLVLITSILTLGYRSEPATLPMVGAHRADWRNHPENSILGVRSSLEMGVSVLEVDIRKTRDRQLILMHDKSLNRTTTGKGRVSDYQLKDLQNVRLKNPIGVPTRQAIPTLKDLMGICIPSEKPVLLDKAEGAYEEVVQVADELDCHELFMIPLRDSLSRAQMDSLKATDLYKLQLIPVLHVTEGYDLKYIDQLESSLNPKVYMLMFDKESKMLSMVIDKIKKNQDKIWINTIWAKLCAGHDDELAWNDPDASWGWVVQQGADIILTDRPQMLIDYLKKSKL